MPASPARQPHAERLPTRPSHDLHHVDRQHSGGAGAQALEHGDGLQLLLDEHPHHAPHADAAQHDDHQADQAQVVLGALAVRGRSCLRSTGTVRTRHELAREALAQVTGQRLDLRAPAVATAHGVVARLPKASRPVAAKVGEVDEDARAEAEAARAAAGLAGDDAADRERRARRSRSRRRPRRRAARAVPAAPARRGPSAARASTARPPSSVRRAVEGKPRPARPAVPTSRATAFGRVAGRTMRQRLDVLAARRCTGARASLRSMAARASRRPRAGWSMTATSAPMSVRASRVERRRARSG